MTNAVAALVVLALVAALAYLQRKASSAEARARDLEAKRKQLETAKQQAERRANAAEAEAFKAAPYRGKLSDAERAALVDSVRAKIRGSGAAGSSVLIDATARKPKP